MRTSATDTPEYRDFCLRAAHGDPELLKSFRTAPEYAGILDVSPELGAEYREKTPHWARRLIPTEFADDPIFDRYAFYLSEFYRLKFPLSNVLEIGGGFGGLALLVAPYAKSYAIVDLPEVGKLQYKFLARQGLPIVMTISPGEPCMPADLVVSTFGFSELVASEQGRYASLYLNPARHGYLICNFIYEESLPPEAYAELEPRGRWLPEEPRSHPLNRVYVW